VPATGTAHNRLLFLLQLFTVLMKQTRQAAHAIKQSIFLDVYVAETLLVITATTCRNKVNLRKF
jgi:cell division protein FtsX